MLMEGREAVEQVAEPGPCCVEGAGPVLLVAVQSLRNVGFRQRVAAFRVLLDPVRFHVLFAQPDCHGRPQDNRHGRTIFPGVRRKRARRG